LQRTPGTFLVSSKLRGPAPLNTALVRLYRFVGRCFRGEATLTEASVGLLFFGGILVGTAAYLALLPFGGEHAPATVLFPVALVVLAFELAAAVAVWRCAYNTRYEGVAIGARALALGYAACTVVLTHASLSAV
jgi:hypothetical protein